jgi:hypothetical protein
MAEDATVGRLRERVVDWMKQRGQGEDWKIEGADREVIDFEHKYSATAIEREIPINIFLKQNAIEVMPSESWINLSDRLVRARHLPLGTMFRIYPVIDIVDNQDSEDHSYDINWEEGKQYWYDIAYDEVKDRSGQAKYCLMA